MKNHNADSLVSGTSFVNVQWYDANGLLYKK